MHSLRSRWSDSSAWLWRVALLASRYPFVIHKGSAACLLTDLYGAGSKATEWATKYNHTQANQAA